MVVRLCLSYALAVLMMFCLISPPVYAEDVSGESPEASLSVEFAPEDGLSPVERMLNSRKESKRLEGAKFKIAKPFLKRTPMGAIVDEISMMIICPTEDDGPEAVAMTTQTLKSYILVKEIDDEMSQMAIYVDKPRGDRFSEIVIINTRPEPAIMLFSGDFTVQSLIKVGELSEQQRKHLKKNK